MNFTVLIACLAISVLSFSINVGAEETTKSLLKASDLKQKTYEEPKGVTDAELRAKGGSRSKWSLKGYLGYTGPRIDKVTEDLRPNPDDLPGDYRTNVNGSLGARFRWSPSTSISADTGIRFYSPLEGATDWESNDPRLSLEKLYPLYGLQMRSTYSGSVTTSKEYSKYDQVGTLNMGHDFKHRFGESRVLFSVGSSFNWFLYDRSPQRGGRKVSNYNFSVYPGLQYNIKDNLNLGSSIAFGYSNLREEPNWWNWDERMPSQRLTLGYGLTRDIYINPYLNFFPQEFNWDTTSLNMNLYLSIF